MCLLWERDPSDVDSVGTKPRKATIASAGLSVPVADLRRERPDFFGRLSTSGELGHASSGRKRILMVCTLGQRRFRQHAEHDRSLVGQSRLPQPVEERAMRGAASATPAITRASGYGGRRSGQANHGQAAEQGRQHQRAGAG